MKANRQYRILASIAILGAFLVTGLWILATIRSPELPTYQGKTIDQWFYGEHRHPGLEETYNDAAIALDAMGTNSIPYLIEKAKGTDSPFNRLYCEIHPSLPDFLRTSLPPAPKSSEVQNTAIKHFFGFSKSELKPFTSSLIAVVPRINTDRFRSEFHRRIVNDLALELSDMKVKKNYFMTLLSDPYWIMNHNGAVALSTIDNSLTNGVPTLLFVLTNRVPLFRRSSAFDSFSSSLADYYEKQAHEALTIIDPELAKQYEKPEPMRPVKNEAPQNQETK